MQNIENWIIILLTSALSLLFLPDFLLLHPQHALWLIIPCLVIAFLLFLTKKMFFFTLVCQFVFLLVCLTYFHSYAIHLIKTAHSLPAVQSKIQTQFRIEEILNQKEYQAVVVKAQLHPEAPKQRIYVNWQFDTLPQLGEYWQGELRIRPISSRLNQGGFDRQMWYLSKGITAYAQVKSAVKLKEDFSWREKKLQDALIKTQNLPEQGLLLALSFGERAWLSAELWQGYQQTNTAHLIAISGSHIALVMLIGWLITRFIQGCFPTRQISPQFPILCGLGLAILYSELAGFTVPTLRAIIALIFLSLCRLNRLYLTPWQLLSRVVAFLLILDPMMLLSSSFWLSVGAVFCLIVGYQFFPLSLFLWRGKSLTKQEEQGNHLGKVRWFISLFHLQFILLWFFTPIQLFLFNGFSLTGFVANLINVPLFSFILVPILLFATLTNGLWQSWQLANDIAFYTNKIIFALQGYWLPLSIKTSLFCTALLTLFFIVWLTFLLKKHNISLNSTSKNTVQSLFQSAIPLLQLSDRLPDISSLKRARKISVSLLIFFLIFLVHQHVETEKWRLETLDVGQGLATLLLKNQRGILYDSGAAWQNTDMAKLEIIPYLQRQGIELDQVILSHDDNDHAGGMARILAAYPQAEFISPSRKNYGNNHRTFCQQGQRWSWQGLQLQVLSPTKILEQAENTDSCVVLVDDGKHKILLTGDADIEAEQQFLPRLLPQIGKIHVLQVGHHGSKTSTGKALVKQIQPDIALISAGRWNPWRHPHNSVVERLQMQGSQIYNTAVSGQVSLIFTDKIQVISARDEWSAWYRQLFGVQAK